MTETVGKQGGQTRRRFGEPPLSEVEPLKIPVLASTRNKLARLFGRQMEEIFVRPEFEESGTCHATHEQRELLAEFAELRADAVVSRPPIKPKVIGWGVGAELVFTDGSRKVVLLVSPIDSAFRPEETDSWVSTESPLGKALLGLKKGSHFSATIPGEEEGSMLARGTVNAIVSFSDLQAKLDI